jgi:Protein of unknown function DUF262
MSQKYFGCRIADLLPRINHEILIPSIQRPYVWEPEQIVKLFDSLMRGYPINTFLFWHLEPSHLGDWEIYRFVRDFRQGDTHNDEASLAKDQAVTLVLDGQQRLTSLLIGLTGSYTVRNGLRGRGAAWIGKVLMLDLLQSPDVSDDDEDGTIVRDLYYGFKFFPIERPPKNDADAVWFKVSTIVQITDRDQLAAHVDRLLLLNPDLGLPKQAVLRSNLSRLWDVVHDEETLAYYLEREQSYDKVLDIFIRANDGGTKLSKSDLLMSMVTLRWDQFSARDETEAVTVRMREILDQESAFDRDYLLRAGLFFNDLDFAFKLRNFTPRNISIIQARWADMKRALLMAARLFARYGITGGALTGQNAVMLVACYLYKLNSGKPDDQWATHPVDDERIRRWITAVIFHGVLSGAANITMEFYRRSLNEQLKVSPRFPMNELVTRMAVRGRTMSFNEETVGKFMAQDNKHRIFKLMLCLLYDRTDWSTQQWQIVQIIAKDRLQEDRLRVQGVQADQIAHYQSWEPRLVNHMILSDEEAKDYFAMEREAWLRSRPAGFWRRHHLPSNPVLYEESAFLDFVKARRKLIAQRLGMVLTDVEPAAAAGPAAAPQAPSLND